MLRLTLAEARHLRLVPVVESPPALRPLPPEGLVLPLTARPRPPKVRKHHWDSSPAVKAYFAYRDRVQVLTTGYDVPTVGLSVTFVMPMPRSWPKRQQAAMLGQYHRARPDVDNLLGGLLNALWPDCDEQVAYLRVGKYWGVDGHIILRQMEG
jgi:Holliday junction resolvase RusA-like endonuclease